MVSVESCVYVVILSMSIMGVIPLNSKSVQPSDKLLGTMVIHINNKLINNNHDHHRKVFPYLVSSLNIHTMSLSGFSSEQVSKTYGLMYTRKLVPV